MVDAAKLHEIHPIHCYSPKGDTVSFKAIRNLLEKTAKDFGVPIAFCLEEITSEDRGSLVIEDCLVVYHPKHRQDYYSVIFRIRRERESAFIQKNVYGRSLRFNPCDVFKNGSQDGDTMESTIEDAEYEAEKNYYRALQAIFKYHRC